MVIIGIVGRPGSGKEEAALYLSKEWGFQLHKLPFLDYCLLLKKEKINLKEEYLSKNKLNNEENKMDSLVICKKQLLDFDVNQVIYPIYSMEQVKYMRKRNYFHLIYIDTPTKLRYQNFCSKYDIKGLDLSDFLEMDDYVYTSTQIHQCIEQANFRIPNFNNLDSLSQFIGSHRSSIERAFRPDWDTYFMKVAYAVKARSNCMKRSVGAVIMQKFRIISTGYNGTPGLMRNCFENGCMRCNSNAKQGVDLHKCVCIHAEESAILEAKLDLMKNATIYTTLFPCGFCAKIIKHVKIKRVVYDEEFDDKNSLKLLKEGGIEICKLELNQYLFNI